MENIYNLIQFHDNFKQENEYVINYINNFDEFMRNPNFAIRLIESYQQREQQQPQQRQQQQE